MLYNHLDFSKSTIIIFIALFLFLKYVNSNINVSPI